jgi:hypothetical protein
MSQQMTWREGQSIAVVTLSSMLIAFAVASGVAALSRGASLPWWVVTPAAWIVAYLTMRTLLRYFFTRHMRQV